MEIYYIKRIIVIKNDAGAETNNDWIDNSND